MKQRLKQLTVLAFALLLGASVNAQNFNVETVKMNLEGGAELTDDLITDCIEKMDAASKHPKTMTNPKMYYYNGLLYLKISQLNNDITAANPNATEVALESFQKCIEVDAKNRYTKMAQDNLLNVAIGLYNKAHTAYGAKDFKTANEYFKKALPLMVYDVDGQLKRNNLTGEVIEQMIAFTAIEMGDNEGAKTALTSLIEKGSTDPSLYSNLALIHLKQGDTATALTVIEAGKEYNGMDKTLINQELDIYLKQGRSEELIEKLNVAIQDDPGNTIYYFARAISYEGLGDLDKAGEDYDKILEIDPSYFDAAYNKGVMYLTRVSKLVDEMNEKNIYKPSEIEVYETEIKGLYSKAIVQFENVFENNDEMKDAERIELARTMKKIYAQLTMMDKYQAMKDYLSSME